MARRSRSLWDRFPVTGVVEVQRPGVATVGPFGDEETTPGDWVETPVAGWYVARSDEKAGESLERVTTTLVVYMPVESSPPPGARIRLPDATVWRVDGRPENYEHGPWFSPGLVVVTAVEVTG